MREDIVSIVEASYCVELGRREWLDGVLGAMRPSIDRGMGVIAFEFDASEPARLRVLDVAYEGTPPFINRESIVGPAESSHADYVRATFRSLPCSLVSKTPGVERQPGWAQLRQLGIQDTLAICGVDPSGIGCWVGALLPKTERLDERTTRKWGHVAAHVAAGLRLRRRLASVGGPPAPLSGADAVLSAKGKIEHAQGEASEAGSLVALRAAAVALDRARGPLRQRNPEHAIAEWKGLIRARWSLIDHFDADGRRYLVARRNEPFVAELEVLSPRERQITSYVSLGHSNKLIAYELGISDSTVRVLLARATAKLGVKSRAKLERLMARLLESARHTKP